MLKYNIQLYCHTKAKKKQVNMRGIGKHEAAENKLKRVFEMLLRLVEQQMNVIVLPYLHTSYIQRSITI